MTADFDDVDTDFDFVKKKRDSKQKRTAFRKSILRTIK